MSRWASMLLLLSMALWTALTAAFGWSLVRPRNAAAQPVVVYDVTSPGSARRVYALTLEQARATLPPPVRAPVKAPTLAARAYPIPEYALDAGVSARVQAADAVAARPAPKPPVPPSKGVIVLDPGHGRGDPGAVHYVPDGSGGYDLIEADSNLENAQRVRDDLEAMGYTVYLTRTGAGNGPGAPLPLQFITSDLYARVALAKAVNAQLYVAFHGNGSTDRRLSGVETWYCGKRAAGDANADLASRLQRAMMDALHAYGYFPPDRGVMEDAARHDASFCQFVVTREAPVPAALVEFLFLTNDADAKVLLDPRAHELMAQYVAAAIDGFMRDRGGGR